MLIVVLSNNRFAAGVNDPGASDLRGVSEGGGMEVLLLALIPEDLDKSGIPLSRFAFTRKLFAASIDSLWESRSRELGSAILKGVTGVGTSAGSSDWDKTRGVALRVPHVISCFTAAGPSSDGVGDGTEGTKEWTSSGVDLGRSRILKCISDSGRKRRTPLLTGRSGYCCVYTTACRAWWSRQGVVRLVVLFR